MFARIYRSVLLVAFVFALGACDRQGPGEEAGETIDEAAEEAGEGVEEAAEEVEDTLESAREELEEENE